MKKFKKVINYLITSLNLLDKYIYIFLFFILLLNEALMLL